MKAQTKNEKVKQLIIAFHSIFRKHISALITSPTAKKHVENVFSSALGNLRNQHHPQKISGGGVSMVVFPLLPQTLSLRCWSEKPQINNRIGWKHLHKAKNEKLWDQFVHFTSSSPGRFGGGYRKRFFSDLGSKGVCFVVPLRLRYGRILTTLLCVLYVNWESRYKPAPSPYTKSAKLSSKNCGEAVWIPYPIQRI